MNKDNNNVDLFNEYWKQHITENVDNTLDECDLEEVIDQMAIDDHLWGFINQSLEDIVSDIKNKKDDEPYDINEAVEKYVKQKEKFLNDFLNDIKKK